MGRTEDGWEGWLDDLGPALTLFARQFTRSHADAEEAVQEGFIRFWTKGRRKADDPKAFLFGYEKTKEGFTLRSGLEIEGKVFEIEFW